MEALFLKLEGVDGDSKVGGFEKQIELLSYEHSVHAQVTGDVSNTNRTSGKPMHRDFQFIKYVDQSTPLLNQKCCEGAVIPSAVVTVGRNDKGTLLEFMVYTLKDVVVSSVTVESDSGDKPVETVTLNYSRIQWDYTVQAETGGKLGTKPGMWNVATNKAE